MNKFLLSLIFLPFFLNAQPSWFYNIKAKDNEIIGYGTSNNLYEAKKYAIDEISKTLNLTIKSQFNIQKTYKKDSLINKDISSNINITSINNLNNISFTNVINIDNLWYVSAIYDNSTLVQKLKKHYKNTILENEKQNYYLANSPLVKSLNTQLGFKLDYSLIRQNNLWYLAYKDKLFFLNQNDFYELFYDYKKNLSLNSNKITYDDNEQIQFRIKSKEKGFISLFNLESNGKVGLLIENIEIKDEINISEFKTVNPYSEQIQEQFIVIKSNKKLNLGNFTKIENELLDVNDFKLNKLLEILNHYDFSSKTIKIKKGYYND